MRLTDLTHRAALGRGTNLCTSCGTRALYRKMFSTEAPRNKTRIVVMVHRYRMRAMTFQIFEAPLNNDSDVCAPMPVFRPAALSDAASLQVHVHLYNSCTYTFGASTVLWAVRSVIQLHQHAAEGHFEHHNSLPTPSVREPRKGASKLASHPLDHPAYAALAATQP